MATQWWQAEWIWASVSWGAVGLAVVTLYVFLLRDRSRGRRRCPKCWYDMSGALAMVDGEGAETFKCPECARDVRHARELFHTRRHWRGAMVGLLVMGVGFGGLGFLRYRTGGWYRVIPGTVLAACSPTEYPRPLLYWPTRRGSAPPSISVHDALAEESWRRVGAGEFWGWQARWFVGRALQSGGGTDSALEAPARWVVGERVLVKLNSPQAAQNFPLDVYAKFDTMPSAPVHMPGFTETPAFSKAGRHVIRATLEFYNKTGAVYSARVDAEVDVVENARAMFGALDSTALSERVRVALDPRLSVLRRDATLVLCTSSEHENDWPGLEMYLGTKIEIRVDGQMAARGVYHPPVRRTYLTSWEQMRVEWEPGMKALACEHPDQVRVRIIGDPDVSWEAYRQYPFGDRDPKCWTGEFECVPKMEPARKAPVTR